MDTIESLKAEIEKIGFELTEGVTSAISDLHARLELAKTNEILVAVKALGTRLDAIEARLPEPEEE